ncbi:MAG TPA: ATP-binding protein [Pyrinomonadaceae bacterium]|nr:ATP-binding protein [Pyrinomonadaceae bacterium]
MATSTLSQALAPESKSLPRSLFLKIFIWFGLIVLTFIGITFLAGEIFRHNAEHRRPPDQSLSIYAKGAIEEYERGGQAALTTYTENVEHQSKLRIFLFNKQLQELSGRRIPASAPDVARRVFETELPEFLDRGPSPLLARPARSSSGVEYVLVAELPPRIAPLIFHPLFHLLAIVLAGALFCYWLARYLTSPIGKLRTATRELADGNLSVRVGQTLGSRRDELVSLAADFDEMAEKIQSLINSQRRLLGDISHELRSPLARLNVALELARQRSGAEAASALDRIHQEAETLNYMIGQLLALTRLESGAQELDKNSLDLAQLVREIVRDADFEARARKRSVVLTSEEKIIVDGVPNLLRPAIENVVRNAVQHTAEGTAVEVNLSTTQTGPDGNSVVLVVRDHGPGVPEESLGKIFRPFYRVDEARNREAGGVGLGLAITERAILLHGGSVQASNAVDGGLNVTIVLPLQTISS